MSILLSNCQKLIPDTSGQQLFTLLNRAWPWGMSDLVDELFYLFGDQGYHSLSFLSMVISKRKITKKYVLHWFYVFTSEWAMKQYMSSENLKPPDTIPRMTKYSPVGLQFLKYFVSLTF